MIWISTLFPLLIIISSSTISAQYRRNTPGLVPVDKFRISLLKVIQDQWDILNNKEDGSQPTDIVKKFVEFRDKGFDDFDENVTISNELTILDTISNWGRVQQKIHKVAVMYNTFKRFQKQQTGKNRIQSPPEVWITFTEAILPSISDNLKQIYEEIQEINLFNKIKELDSTSICLTQQSPHQHLYNLYNTISLTEIKGFAMIQFSYILLKMYGKGNYTTESQLEREQFIERGLNTAAKMDEVMARTSRDLWRCDPEIQEEGKTYLEITQLLQGYIQNEVDLNPDGTCWENCAAYEYTKSHSCYKNLYCRQQRRCQGKILNCKFIKSDMQVCPSNNTLKRRYDYIEYENGQVYGHKGSCPKGRVEVESWWRWLFWHCSYCMCLCDEEGIFSDRYFSMKSVLSDVLNNKIITGVKFAKSNRIIHLQIEQGELLQNGVVNKTTIEWVPIDSFRLNDRNVLKDQTYFTLSRDNRAIDLDVHAGVEGYVLTGVRLQKIGSHLNLQIYVTPYDFATGKLKPALSEWLDNTNTEFSMISKRKKIEIKDRDVPTRSNLPSKIKSTHNEFLEFTHTSFEKDAAQTTVPFLDSQPVSSGLSPNSGAGIYYKTSSDQNGGYIGLKLVTFDYSKHLLKKVDLEEEPEAN
ncbi:uncharacterized protein [Onthophagus taurus]|uniref:uncharacterized protein isoform X2 n=1 Tax=Onthophagus taurus TaxID=166361 RepID=UPI0039BE1268